MKLTNRKQIIRRSKNRVGARSTAASRYATALIHGHENSDWKKFQPLSGLMAPPISWYPSAGPPTLGDVDGVAEDITSGLGNLVDSRTKKLENALTAILALSAVAALTGIINVVRR